MRPTRTTPSGRRAALSLTGRRVAVTRAADQAGELADGIRLLGGEPVLCPAIVIAPPEDPRPLDDAIDRVSRGGYAWIAITSANAARALGERFAERGLVLPRAVRLAAIGPATANACARYLRSIDLIAVDHLAGSLGAAIPLAPGERVLFPHAELARDTLAGTLRQRGAVLDEVIAYRTAPGPGLGELVAGLGAGALDAVLFASASAVRFTARALDAAGVGPGRAAVFCVGPSTEAEAREHGLSVAGTADPHTAPGLLDVVARWFALRGDQLHARDLD